MDDLDAEIRDANSLRFPSAIEIIGGLAAIVPFVLHISSSSMSSVNGRTTSFVYRDWVAVGGGAVAVLCALAAAASLLRTAPARRVQRGAAAAVLLGLGAYHVLRGFGLVGVPGAEQPVADVTSAAPAPAAPAEPQASPAELDAATRRMFDQWQGNTLKQLYDEGHPKLRSSASLAVLQTLHDDMTLATGSFVKLGAPLSYTADHGVQTVKGPAVFEKGEIGFTLTFRLVDAKPVLAGFDLRLPQELQVAGVADDGVKTARQMLDGLLQDKLQLDALNPALIPKLGAPAEFEVKLKKVLDQIGKVLAVKLTDQHECKGLCLSYEIRGAKGTGTCTFELGWSVRRWRINAFEMSPPQKRK